MSRRWSIIQCDSNTDIINLRILNIRIEWWIETEGEAHRSRCCLVLQYYHKIYKFVQQILYKSIQKQQESKGDDSKYKIKNQSKREILSGGKRKKVTTKKGKATQILLAHREILIAKHLEPVSFAMGPEPVIPREFLMTSLHRTNIMIKMSSHEVAMDRAPIHPTVAERAPTFQLGIGSFSFVLLNVVRPQVGEH